MTSLLPTLRFPSFLKKLTLVCTCFLYFPFSLFNELLWPVRAYKIPLFLEAGLQRYEHFFNPQIFFCFFSIFFRHVILSEAKNLFSKKLIIFVIQL